MRIGVIGAGPSGLAVAWELVARAHAAGAPLEVEVYERGVRPGGNVWTDAAEGYLVEQGPEGFLDSSPRTLELAAELGLVHRVIAASDRAHTRFLYVNRRLEPVPLTPPAFLGSRILSIRGRLRVLGEPFCRPGTAPDESVEQFATRRLGWEAAHRLIGAMVAGIYAGDPAQLSMPATFPRLVAMERRHGSLTRALMSARLAVRKRGAEGRIGGPAGPSGRLTSFVGGMRELIEGLVRALDGRVHAGANARSVRRVGDAWRVSFAGRRDEEFDRLIVTTPPWQAAQLLADVDGDLADAIAQIPSAPVAAVALGFRKPDLAGVNLEGLGFLATPGEGIRALGCLWSSSIFPGRAPEGRALLRILVGGTRDPAAADLADDALLDLVRADLRAVMGIAAAPEFVRIYHHPRAIPQYTLGHLGRLATITERLRAIPGLVLHGNGYRGVALNDCIRLAGDAAAAALAGAPAYTHALA